MKRTNDDQPSAAHGGSRRGAGRTRFVASPAAERNKLPILNVLRETLPERGLVLEVASGAGEHVVYFARALPGLDWQPTERDPESRALIAARLEVDGSSNVREPLDLDASSSRWPIERADAVICINMIHIAPWAAAEGLIAGAARVLPPEGVLFLYGPFRRFGRHTAPSNEAFDESLRARNPQWGVRDLERVVALAAEAGLELREAVSMPANNFSVSFRAASRAG